ncbi:MAG: ParA family protein [Natronomonas sp.]|uniref:ParA family protein n=1 Tax=Natronomonas sp. TaxID=2184060 RepID=UPI00287040DF|nr:ParA family protein [Natronomonas sp.]MDR9381739.1 ParA family protein [Natronomonas sp.]MDR9429484.1 ParA family protein [Natronomonas sp.]
MSTTVAFVGAAGGVGTTRLTLESGRLLAGNGIDTAILDASYGTQGLSDRVSGRLDPDVTALCLRETPLEEGLVDLPMEGAGRLAACPAHAPFERLARAKAPDAAERFGELIDEAARHFECVLVDTPPVATNPAVAAVTAVETVAMICDDDRAQSALPRTEDRLADVGTDSSATFVTRTSEHPDADVAIPTFERSPATARETAIYDALCDVVETVTDVSIERPEPEGVLDQLRFK